jgi:MFS transporter, DHA2 family, multidrug resistance protein
MFDSGTRRWWAVGALVLAVLAVGLDVTVLSLALPELAGGLHASTAELQWFVAAYTLVFAAAMIPGGVLGDRFGRKKLLIIALVIFGGSSVAAAYASSPGAFIAARAVLGLGGAVIVPMVLGVIPTLFDTEERRKAIAVVMAATVLGFPIGPILGGWLLSRFWWGSVFLINVPVVVIALFAVVAWLPESRSVKTRKLDSVGALSSSAGLALLTYGVIEAGTNGWGDATAVVPLIAGAIIIAGFAGWERRVAEPLIDITLFRSAGFTWGTILSTSVTFTMFGVLFAMPQYFQAILRTGAMGSGVRLLPLIGGMLAGVAVADRLAGRIGDKVTCGLGFALLAGGMFAGATTSVGSGFGSSAAWMAVCGAGLGFVMPTAMNAALGSLAAENSGVGSAVVQAVRMVGGSFGAAILGSVLSSGYLARVDLTGLPAGSAATVRSGVFGGLEVAGRTGSAALLGSVRGGFVHGLDLVLAVGGGLGVLGAVLALLFLPRRVEAVGGIDPEHRQSDYESAL